MSEISQEIVEATWQEVAGLSPKRAQKEIGRIAQTQPDLLPFVLALTGDCSPQAQELAVYLCYVVLRIFEKATPRRIPPIKGSRIERQYGQSEQLLLRLEGAHPRFLEKAALAEMSRQPFVVKYVVEAIMEAPEDEDPVQLTEDEKGILFLVLKTVIDALDDARARVEKGPAPGSPGGIDPGRAYK